MNLDVNLLHWLLAALPIVMLILLLVRYEWTAQQAGSLGIFIAGLIALFAFEAPIKTLTVASGKGIWDAIFILYVIWPALFLYQVMNQSGGYNALRHGIARMSRNELFIVVALGWVFSSFLQGIDGFGTPIAVVAPLLVAFGMRPVYAVAIPIIAHVWAKFYGTLGVGWLATVQVVDATPEMWIQTAWMSGLLICLQAYMGGFMIVWMYGRWQAVKAGWPLVLIIATIQGFGQMLVAVFDPVLAAFIPATVALLALYPLSRWKRYAEADPNITERPAMRDDAQANIQDEQPTMRFAVALAPYALLTVLALSTSLITPLRNWLHVYDISWSFPQVSTGFGVVTAASPHYAPLHIFTHPGACILLTTIITWFVFKSRGYFAMQAAHTNGKQPGILLGLAQGSVPASVPILAFLIIASIMKHSGQNQTLALGIAAVAPAYVFAFLSNGIGALGAFMTSSSTSSQVLFSDLQVTLAKAKSLPETIVLAAQCAGSATGNAIAPANIVMGASTAGINGKEGEILRKTIPWTVATIIVTGFATILLLLVM